MVELANDKLKESHDRKQINLTFGIFGMNVDTTGRLVPFTNGLNRAEALAGSPGIVWQMLDPLRIQDHAAPNPINTWNPRNDMLFFVDFYFWSSQASRLAINLDGYDADTLKKVIVGGEATYRPIDPFSQISGEQGTLNTGLNVGSPYLKSVTDWEIFQIYHNPELRKKATFYVNSSDGSLTVKDVRNIMPGLGLFQVFSKSPLYKPGLSAKERPASLKLPELLSF